MIPPSSIVSHVADTRCDRGNPYRDESLEVKEAFRPSAPPRPPSWGTHPCGCSLDKRTTCRKHTTMDGAAWRQFENFTQLLTRWTEALVTARARSATELFWLKGVPTGAGARFMSHMFG